ncbi:MAG: dihydroorotase [Thermoplasmataceae archaeon]
MEDSNQADFYLHGKFYRSESFQDLYIGISEGKITSLKKFQNVRKVIELSGAIFPGGVDAHVHFRDPGETEKEDFASGSISAIFGGTTTVLDMPNNLTPVIDYGVYDSKKSAINRRSYCNYGLYSMFTGNNSSLIHEESIGIKVYMGESTNTSGVEEISESEQASLNELDKNIVFHSESAKCLNIHRFMEKKLCDHHLSRPSECEEISMNAVNSFSMKRKICAHISDFGNVEKVKKVTFAKEMLPQHMLLSCEKLSGSWAKVNPPIRDEKTRIVNLQAFLDGKVDIVSSDHAPHTEYDKTEFQTSKSGMIGVETRIPLLLNLVKKGILPMKIFAKTAIQNPTAIFGLNKGFVEIGYDADFFSVDLSNIRRINQERLHSKNPFTAFNNFEAIFPSDVIIGGNRVLDGFEVVGGPSGHYISGKKTKMS